MGCRLISEEFCFRRVNSTLAAAAAPRTARKCSMCLLASSGCSLATVKISHLPPCLQGPACLAPSTAFAALLTKLCTLFGCERAQDTTPQDEPRADCASDSCAASSLCRPTMQQTGCMLSNSVQQNYAAADLRAQVDASSPASAPAPANHAPQHAPSHALTTSRMRQFPWHAHRSSCAHRTAAVA